jgi:PAS domain S-box-containing protein
VVGIYHHNPLTVGTLWALALLWAAVPLLMARRANRSTLDEAARNALESSPCGSAVIDATGRIVWVNAAFAAQIDRGSDSMAGTLLSDVAREDLWAELESRREELDRGVVIDVSSCLVRADGEEVWVAGHVRAMEPESGRLCLQLVDVSSALGAQDSLAKSVAEFRQALESSNDLILMVSKHGKINYANPVATSCLAGDADLNEAVITDLVELNDRERFITALKNSRKQGEVAELSGLHLLRPDRDSDFPVAARIAGLRTPDGVGGAIVTCRLMDDQIASERELRSSEARFSRIFHSSPDAILIVRNADSTILDFNAGFIRLLGYTREDAIGQAESDMQLWVHEAERERILNNLQTDQEVTAQETKLRRKNGAVVYVELSLRYIEIEERGEIRRGLQPQPGRHRHRPPGRHADLRHQRSVREFLRPPARGSDRGVPFRAGRGERVGPRRCRPAPGGGRPLLQPGDDPSHQVRRGDSRPGVGHHARGRRGTLLPHHCQGPSRSARYRGTAEGQ